MHNQIKYKHVIEDVENVFNQIYKGHVDVIMFGSRATGLATKDTSDIDLFIDTSKLMFYFILSVINYKSFPETNFCLVI